MKSFIAIVAVVLTLYTVQVGQVNEERRRLSLAALSKIVDVVLRAEFKPREEPTLIYIRGDVLREAWLPEIANTQFILINDAELERHGKACLFKDPVFIEGKVRDRFRPWRHLHGIGRKLFFHGKRRSRYQNKRHAGLGISLLFRGRRYDHKRAIDAQFKMHNAFPMHSAQSFAQILPVFFRHQHIDHSLWLAEGFFAFLCAFGFGGVVAEVFGFVTITEESKRFQ